MKENTKKKGIIILNKDLSIRWIDIMKRANLNTLGLHCLYPYGGLKGHIEWLKKEETCKLLEEFEKANITVEHQIHAVDWLMPRDLFNEHKDWFRTDVNGNKVKDWNLCVSNNEALDYIENSAYKLASILKQKTHNYYIWSDDCLNSICYCENCKKYNGADQNMIIMKSILKGIKKYDKNAKLSFLAYQDSDNSPTIVPDKDMFLEFAPITRNHFKPILSDDEKNIAIQKSFNSFLEIFPKKSSEVLEYFLDVSYYCGWKRENAKPLNLDIEQTRKDLEYYCSKGIKGITTFAAFMDDEWLDKYGDEDIIKYGKLLKEYLG